MKVKVAQSCPTLCNPMDYTVHGILQPEYWSGQPFPSPGDLPNPGIKPRSPALQVDSLPTSYEGSPNINEHLLFAEAALGPGKKNSLFLKNTQSSGETDRQCSRP